MVARYYDWFLWLWNFWFEWSWLTGPVMVFALMWAAVADDDGGHLRGLLALVGVGAALLGPLSILWIPGLSAALDEAKSTNPNLGPGWLTPGALAGLDTPPVLWWVLGGGLGYGLWWVAFRWLPIQASKVRDRLTKSTHSARAGRTDIRYLSDRMPANSPKYDPVRYFRPDAVFVGTDKSRKPVYLPYELVSRCHVHLIGTTGTGKGVAAGLFMSQCLANGEAVIAVDPKNDEWAPHLLRHEAERLGRRFVLIDLRAETPQFNLLAGATPAQVEELLIAGFGLSDKGEAADHYRLGDRKAARLLSRQVIAANRHATLADLAEAAEADSAMAEYAAGLVLRLEEVAALESCNAAEGHNLAELIEEGAAVYVIGSMRHASVSVIQRALLVRLCQIVEHRDRIAKQPRKLLIFLDEFVAHISKPAKEMLQTVRDKGAHIVLAHTAKSDLAEAPADLNAKAVEGAVIENCKIRISYKVTEEETAKWLAGTTGRILIDDEARKIERKSTLIEETTGERTIRVAEDYRIPVNIFQGAEERIGILAAPGVMEPVHICPIPVTKRPLEIEPGIPRAAQVVPVSRAKPKKPAPAAPDAAGTIDAAVPHQPTASPPSPARTPTEELPDVDL